MLAPDSTSPKSVNEVHSAHLCFESFLLNLRPFLVVLVFFCIINDLWLFTRFLKRTANLLDCAGFLHSFLPTHLMGFLLAPLVTCQMYCHSVEKSWLPCSMLETRGLEASTWDGSLLHDGYLMLASHAKQKSPGLSMGIKVVVILHTCHCDPSLKKLSPCQCGRAVDSMLPPKAIVACKSTVPSPCVLYNGIVVVIYRLNPTYKYWSVFVVPLKVGFFFFPHFKSENLGYFHT